MLKNVDNIDFQIACILIISGILICVIAILIIKIVANYIWMTGRIVYKRYLFPIISCLGISVFYKDIAQYIKIPSSFEVWIYVCVAIGIIEIFDLVKKVGLVRGICMFIIQMVVAGLCICLLYMGVVMLVVGIIAFVGGSEIIENKYIVLMAVDDGERIYVKRRNDYYFDQYGRYYRTFDNCVVREDNKIFMFL